MPMSAIQDLEIQISHELAQYWGWFLAFGIGLALLGVAAVVRSVTATIASLVFFGWLLLLASGIEVAQGVLVGHWAGFFQHLLTAILFGVTGLLIVARPLIGAEVATLFIAMFFLIGELLQLVASLVVGWSAWGWGGSERTIRIALGVSVLFQWPASGLWVIGLFIGIDLIFYGCVWIALALGLHWA